MRNKYTTSIQRYYSRFHSFDSELWNVTGFYLHTGVYRRILLSLFMVYMIPMVPLVAQNQKTIEMKLKENIKYYTPQLAGSSVTVKPMIERTVDVNNGRMPSEPRDNVQSMNSSVQMTWPQLMAKVNASQANTDVTIYTGAYNQCAPQIVTSGSVMYVAFESYDTQSGLFPYGSIQIYLSTNSGSTWSGWNYVNSSSYQLTSPQIMITGGAVNVSYVRNGTLRTMRLDLSNANPFVPLPNSSTNEYVVAYRMVSDIEQYPSNPWLYMATLFKRADGRNRVFFSCSQDTGRTWGWYNGAGTFYVNSYDSLGLSQTELGKASIGFDYGRSGLYIAYLGTGTNAGNICMRKSTSLGASWTTEINLLSAGINSKVGPMIAAVGQRVAVVYQYDYNGTATDWKTSGAGGDFDVIATVSSDGGTSWYTRWVAGTSGNELLPWVTHDVDSSFYVSFIMNNKTRISMAGNEFAFCTPDSSSSANASLDYFPSVFGSTVSGAKTAYTTWTGTYNGLDIYGTASSLRIPPLTPTNLTVTGVTSSQINLSWTDNSFNETGYRVYWINGTTSTYIDLNSNVTSYQVTGLPPSTTYTLYVYAFNANGFSNLSNTVTATTLPSVSAPIISIPTFLSFGSVNAGSSLQKTLTIGNTGNATLTGTLSIPPNSGYTLSSTSLSVAAGSTQNFTVTFSPLVAQNYNTTLTVAHNAAGSPSTVSLSGIGVSLSAPVISIPTFLSFGSVNAGSSLQKTLTIGNTGNATLTGTLSIPPNSGYTLNSTSLSVVAGSTQDFTVTFSPLAAQTYNSSITVTHNAAGSPSSVSLSGTGVGVPGPVPVISILTELLFGNVSVGSSLQKTLTIGNTGDAILVGTLSLPANSGYTLNSTSFTIASGSNRDFTVIFSPLAGQNYNTSITVTHNAAGSPSIVSLSGTGVGGPPSITSFSPTSGPIGTTVTITGTNFSTTAARNVVYFGAVKATITSATSNQLSVIVPAGATHAPITVTDTTSHLLAVSRIPFMPTFAGSPMIDANSFAAKMDFTTGANPHHVFVSDVDGDGKPDIVLTNMDGNTISVLRNTSISGTISFAAKVDYATGISPYAVSIGDVNGDGKSDIIVTNWTSNTVSVLRNTCTSGTISFAAKVDFATGSAPRGVSIGDVDGDGKLDIIVTNSFGNTVSVLRNTCTSSTVSFENKVDFVTGTAPLGVSMGDVDGDGIPDIVIANGNSATVSILRNTSTAGALSFAAKVDFATITNPYEVSIGDVDGDGKPDIVVGSWNVASVSVLRNTSTTGAIACAVKTDFAIGSGTYGVSIGDMNGDGKLDIVVSNNTIASVSVLRNTSISGTVSFAGKSDYTTGSGVYGVSINDMDGDGKPDIVAANGLNNTLSVLRNTVGRSDGLVAWYPFNGNANDESGNGHNGTVYGSSLSTDRFGQSYRSMYFDGVTNYIDIGNFGPINDETISLWFKKSVKTNYPSSGEKDLIGTQNSCNITHKVGFHTEQKDKIVFSVADSGCTPNNRYKMVYTNSPVADSIWHHLVLTHSGSTMLIYVDNQLSATSLWVGSRNTTDAIITGSNTLIGQGGIVNPSSQFSGNIDDIRIYNRILTQTEISQLYQEGGWTGITPPSAPTAVAATNVQQTSFTANWNSVSNATGYRLDVSTNSGFTSFVSGFNDKDLGNVTSTSVSGLTTSTTYYYRVRAYNASGTSASSNTITVQPAVPVISIPNALAFSTVGVGSSLQKTLTIGNTGNAVLTGTLSLPANSVYTLISTSLNVAAGSTQDFTVTFSPPAEQNYNTSLTVTHNAAGNPSTVTLSGTGGRSSISVSPSSVLVVSNGAFASTVVGTVTITNNGTATLNGTLSYSGSSALSVSPGTISIAAGSYSTLTLSISSVTVADGTYSGTITITHNAAGSPTLIPVQIRKVSISSSFAASKQFTFDSTNSGTNYKLIGIPGNTSFAASSVFTGTYKQDWRMYRDNGMTSTNPKDYLIEYDGSSAFNFGEGRGFWVLAKQSKSFSATLSNYTASGAFPISLHSDWNVITNPFVRTVLWGDVQTYNQLTANSVIYSWNNGAWSLATSFVPYVAYYFYNVGNTPVLSIPYDANGTLARSNALAKTSETIPVPVSDQHLKISISTGDVEISSVYVGFDEHASNTYDDKDYFAPPASFAVANIQIENKNLSTDQKRLWIEHRRAVGEGQRFHLIVKNTSSVSTLSVEGLDKFPDDQIYLMDEQRKELYDLKLYKHFDVATNSDEYRYSLLIGDKHFVDTIKAVLVPTTFSVAQNYPNPFNPTTTIEYTLPQQSYVKMTIYDMMGREVAVPVAGIKNAGRYSVIWNAADCSSGVYFCRVTMGNYSSIKKLLVVK